MVIYKELGFESTKNEDAKRFCAFVCPNTCNCSWTVARRQNHISFKYRLQSSSRRLLASTQIVIDRSQRVLRPQTEGSDKGCRKINQNKEHRCDPEVIFDASNDSRVSEIAHKVMFSAR